MYFEHENYLIHGLEGNGYIKISIEESWALIHRIQQPKFHVQCLI